MEDQKSERQPIRGGIIVLLLALLVVAATFVLDGYFDIPSFIPSLVFTVACMIAVIVHSAPIVRSAPSDRRSSLLLSLTGIIVFSMFGALEFSMAADELRFHFNPFREVIECQRSGGLWMGHEPDTYVNDGEGWKEITGTCVRVGAQGNTYRLPFDAEDCIPENGGTIVWAPPSAQAATGSTQVICEWPLTASGTPDVRPR